MGDLGITNKDINLKIRYCVLRRNVMCGEVILQYNCFISQANIVSVFINFNFLFNANLNVFHLKVQL